MYYSYQSDDSLLQPRKKNYVPLDEAPYFQDPGDNGDTLISPRVQGKPDITPPPSAYQARTQVPAEPIPRQPIQDAPNERTDVRLIDDTPQETPRQDIVRQTGNEPEVRQTVDQDINTEKPHTPPTLLYKGESTPEALHQYINEQMPSIYGREIEDEPSTTGDTQFFDPKNPKRMITAGGQPLSAEALAAMRQQYPDGIPIQIPEAVDKYYRDYASKKKVQPLEGVQSPNAAYAINALNKLYSMNLPGASIPRGILNATGEIADMAGLPGRSILQQIAGQSEGRSTINDVQGAARMTPAEQQSTSQSLDRAGSFLRAGQEAAVIYTGTLAGIHPAITAGVLGATNEDNKTIQDMIRGGLSGAAFMVIAGGVTKHLTPALTEAISIIGDKTFAAFGEETTEQVLRGLNAITHNGITPTAGAVISQMAINAAEGRPTDWEGMKTMIVENLALHNIAHIPAVANRLSPTGRAKALQDRIDSANIRHGREIVTDDNQEAYRLNVQKGGYSPEVLERQREIDRRTDLANPTQVQLPPDRLVTPYAQPNIKSTVEAPPTKVTREGKSNLSEDQINNIIDPHGEHLSENEIPDPTLQLIDFDKAYQLLFRKRKPGESYSDRADYQENRDVVDNVTFLARLNEARNPEQQNAINYNALDEAIAVLDNHLQKNPDDPNRSILEQKLADFQAQKANEGQDELGNFTPTTPEEVENAKNILTQALDRLQAEPSAENRAAAEEANNDYTRLQMGLNMANDHIPTKGNRLLPEFDMSDPVVRAEVNRKIKFAEVPKGPDTLAEEQNQELPPISPTKQALIDEINARPGNGTKTQADIIPADNATKTQSEVIPNDNVTRTQSEVLPVLGSVKKQPSKVVADTIEDLNKSLEEAKTPEEVHTITQELNQNFADAIDKGNENDANHLLKVIVTSTTEGIKSIPVTEEAPLFNTSKPVEVIKPKKAKRLSKAELKAQREKDAADADTIIKKGLEDRAQLDAIIEEDEAKKKQAAGVSWRDGETGVIPTDISSSTVGIPPYVSVYGVVHDPGYSEGYDQNIPYPRHVRAQDTQSNNWGMSRKTQSTLNTMGSSFPFLPINDRMVKYTVEVFRDGLGRIGEGIKNALDSIQRQFAPHTIDKDSKLAAQRVARMHGSKIREVQAAEHAMKQAVKAFDKVPTEVSDGVVDDFNKGNFNNPSYGPIQKSLMAHLHTAMTMLDNALKAAEKARPGSQEDYMEHQFPILLENTPANKALLNDILLKNGLGRKDVKNLTYKGDVLGMYKELRAAGATFIDPNPVVMALNMNAALHGQVVLAREIQDGLRDGSIVAVRSDELSPTGFKKLEIPSGKLGIVPDGKIRIINANNKTITLPESHLNFEYIHPVTKEKIRGWVDPEEAQRAEDYMQAKAAKKLPKKAQKEQLIQQLKAQIDQAVAETQDAHQDLIRFANRYGQSVEKVLAGDPDSPLYIQADNLMSTYNQALEAQRNYQDQKLGLMSNRPPTRVSFKGEDGKRRSVKYNDLTQTGGTVKDSLTNNPEDKTGLREKPRKQTVDYYAPESAARVFNNYLVPKPTNAPLRFLETVGSAIRTAEMALSAFHFYTVSTEASIAKHVLAVMDLREAGDHLQAGKLGEAGKAIARGSKRLVEGAIPFYAGVEAAREGAKIREATFDPFQGAADPKRANIGKILTEGGLHLTATQEFRASFTRKARQRWRGQPLDKLIALGTTPIILLDIMSGPLHRYIANVKNAVVAERTMNAIREHEAKGGLLADLDVQQIVMDTGKNVENVAGQLPTELLHNSPVSVLVYRNLFNFLGWNAGTIREVLNGASDIASIPTKFKKGERALSPTAIGWLVRSIHVGFTGAIIQYLATGKLPGQDDDFSLQEGTHDMLFPQIGGETNGRKNRFRQSTIMGEVPGLINMGAQALSGNFKSVIHYGKSKLNVTLSSAIELMQNEDWLGRQIYPEYPLADIPQAIKDVVGYFANRIVPISQADKTGLASKDVTTTDKLHTVATRAISFALANKENSSTTAQMMLDDIWAKKVSRGGLSKEAEAYLNERRQVKDDIAHNDFSSLIRGVEDGQLKPEQAQEILRNQSLMPYAKKVQMAPLGEMLDIWRYATAEEKQAWSEVMVNKFKALEKMPPVQRLALIQKARDIGFSVSLNNKVYAHNYQIRSDHALQMAIVQSDTRYLELGQAGRDFVSKQWSKIFNKFLVPTYKPATEEEYNDAADYLNDQYKDQVDKEKSQDATDQIFDLAQQMDQKVKDQNLATGDVNGKAPNVIPQYNPQVGKFDEITQGLMDILNPPSPEKEEEMD